MEATIEEKEPVGALHKWSGQLQDILGLEATPGDEGMMAVEDAVAALIARAETAGLPMPDKTPLELARDAECLLASATDLLNSWARESYVQEAASEKQIIRLINDLWSAWTTRVAEAAAHNSL